MPDTVQEFIAKTTQKAATDLAAALERIPQDKQDWSPEGKGRSALDQAAECVVLNGYTTRLIQSRQWPNEGFEAFLQEKAEAAAAGGESLRARLQDSTDRLVAAIHAAPSDALGDEIQLPWSVMTLAEVLTYPSWNMTYHLGQINYLASLLGVLD